MIFVWFRVNCSIVLFFEFQLNFVGQKKEEKKMHTEKERNGEREKREIERDRKGGKKRRTKNWLIFFVIDLLGC